jgi:hypothetical protein
MASQDIKIKSFFEELNVLSGELEAHFGVWKSLGIFFIFCRNNPSSEYDPAKPESGFTTLAEH